MGDPQRRGGVKRKNEVAAKLACSLTEFYPECADQFLCPTCLRFVPLNRPEDISEAHIVPRAAGGRVATVLCRKCNSTFGTRQDKWMAEYW